MKLLILILAFSQTAFLEAAVKSWWPC